MNTVTQHEHKTNHFKWLLKREFWENRGGFLWAPVITGIIVIALTLLLSLIGTVQVRSSDFNVSIDSDINTHASLVDTVKAHSSGLDASMGSDINTHAQQIGRLGDGILLAGVLLAMIVMAFVVFFYALGSLYDDRRDRSVLFWKSLPISDLETVLSKATWALLLAPLLAVAIGLVIGVTLWLIAAGAMASNGLPGSSAMFTHSHPLRVIGQVLCMIPVYLLWALPTVGWLMLCSAWSRSKPFLWAVLIPVLSCTVISMMSILPGIHIPHKAIWYVVVGRGLMSVAPGAWMSVIDKPLHPPAGDMSDVSKVINLTDSWQALTTANLWIGVAIGIAFIATAVYLRRWRELAD